MCAINTLVGDGSRTGRGMGMALLKQFETTSFAVTNPCSLLLCRVVSLMKWNSGKNTRVDHTALAVPFHSSTIQFQTSKRTRIPPFASQ